MDEYTIEELKYKNGFDAGYQRGFDAGKKAADSRNQPESPYVDDNVLECPRCGCGEYLTIEDGNLNGFCGHCGQALAWGERKAAT